jgi:hypothetical protein
VGLDQAVLSELIPVFTLGKAKQRELYYSGVGTALRAELSSSNAMHARHMVDGVDRLGRENKRDKQQQGLGGP